MLNLERPEFETILAELFGALDKPLTEAKKDGFWRGLSKMSLIEFGRARDVLLEDLSDGEPRKTFSVSDIWSAKHRARRHVVDHPAVDQKWGGDKWDIVANNHMLAMIIKRALAKRGYTPEQTKILILAKDAFAADLRDEERAQGNGGVDIETQVALFSNRMSHAHWKWGEVFVYQRKVAA